jgi:hypothetical protein
MPQEGCLLLVFICLACLCSLCPSQTKLLLNLWRRHLFTVQCVVEIVALLTHVLQVSLDTLFRGVVCACWIGVGWVCDVPVN